MKKTLIIIFTSLIFSSCGKVNNEHTLLYLVNERPDEVVIVDTSDQKVINRFMAGEGLNDLTLVPDQGIGFIANQHGGVISVVDLNMGTLESEIPTNGFPLHLTSPPSGEKVYATIANPETLQANEVSVFSVSSSSFIESIPIGNTINNIEIHPDGKTLYATRANTAMLFLVDTTKKTIRKEKVLSNSPAAMAVSPDGKYIALALTQTDTVQIYDQNAEDLIFSIPVGDAPRAVTFSDDGKLVLAADMRTRFVHIAKTESGEIIGKIKFDMAPTNLRVVNGKVWATVKAPFIFGADLESLEITDKIHLNSIPVTFEAIAPNKLSSNNTDSGLPITEIAIFLVIFYLIKKAKKREKKEKEGK
ncbi:hypothetical protein CL659_02415 [bacterium]|nr:hypothetical protein [bacterium]|tara:strand:+ start:1106 stop:2188 length:1083 start_codon:yes stop_codon:yes gene_type:complete